MNRRKFIGGLLKGILTASVAPQVIVNATTKWKKTGLIWESEAILTHDFAAKSFCFAPTLQDYFHIVTKKPWPSSMGEVIRPVDSSHLPLLFKRIASDK